MTSRKRRVHNKHYKEIRQWQFPKRKNLTIKTRDASFARQARKPTYVEDKNSGDITPPAPYRLKSGMYKGRKVLAPKED